MFRGVLGAGQGHHRKRTRSGRTAVILFKSCPKCGTGDLVRTSDLFGAYVECVQCGFTRDIARRKPVTMAAPAEQRFQVATRRSA
jgi:Zn ribbon nucleic-acid-binding protein